MLKLTFGILGNLASKANSRRIGRNRYTGRMFSIKSKSALEFFDAAIWQLKEQMKKIAFKDFPITEQVILRADVYYQSRRSDLDVSLLQDVIETANIIENDRQIFQVHAKKYLDKNNPRVEFQIEII